MHVDTSQCTRLGQSVYLVPDSVAHRRPRPLSPPPYQRLLMISMAQTLSGSGAATRSRLQPSSRCLEGLPKFLDADPLCSPHWAFSQWDPQYAALRRAWACSLLVEVCCLRCLLGLK